MGGVPVVAAVSELRPLDFARGPVHSQNNVASAPLGRTPAVAERSRGHANREIKPVPERSRGVVPKRSPRVVPERSQGVVPERSRRASSQIRSNPRIILPLKDDFHTGCHTLEE
jgi:hypothetical protein